jgi:hypothetical protein
VALPVFKTGLAGIAFAGRFDSFPPPPERGTLARSKLRAALRRKSWKSSDGTPARAQAAARFTRNRVVLTLR